MGILLVLGVVVLAFLCGRLQVTVTHLRKEVAALVETVNQVRTQVEDMED